MIAEKAQPPNPVAIPTDTWMSMNWDEYLTCQAADQLEKAKGYYYKGHGRFEMLPVGFGHGTNHVVVTYALNLFCAIKAIPLRMADTTTLRKAGTDDCQPDLSIWLGDKARAIPTQTGIVNLNHHPAPDLVVEVSNTSLLDDLGVKRSLYENLHISEYWIVDVKQESILSFEVLNRGSRRIEVSKVLPNFSLSTLEEAVQLSHTSDQAQMGAWLLQKFQSIA
ncbi:MAG: Uma2 family endonuclease [Cyanobacteria bacterium J06554_11]